MGVSGGGALQLKDLKAEAAFKFPISRLQVKYLSDTKKCLKLKSEPTSVAKPSAGRGKRWKADENGWNGCWLLCLCLAFVAL